MATSPLPEGAAITACMAQHFGLWGVRAWAARSATTGDAMALACSQGAPHRLPHGSRRDHQRPRPPCASSLSCAVRGALDGLRGAWQLRRNVWGLAPVMTWSL
jgi:hypothetical protein